MRKPKAKNKYNLKPKDIEKAKILNYERLKEYPFWWNKTLKAWCIIEDTSKTNLDREFGTYDEFWIGFYSDKSMTPGEIELKCYSYGGMCRYNFESFFNPNEIENEIDLEIQEKLLSRINWLIDEGIVKIEGIKK